MSLEGYTREQLVDFQGGDEPPPHPLTRKLICEALEKAHKEERDDAVLKRLKRQGISCGSNATGSKSKSWNRRMPI